MGKCSQYVKESRVQICKHSMVQSCSKINYICIEKIQEGEYTKDYQWCSGVGDDSESMISFTASRTFQTFYQEHVWLW